MIKSSNYVRIRRESILDFEVNKCKCFGVIIEVGCLRRRR